MPGAGGAAGYFLLVWPFTWWAFTCTVFRRLLRLLRLFLLFLLAMVFFLCIPPWRASIHRLRDLRSAGQVRFVRWRASMIRMTEERDRADDARWKNHGIRAVVTLLVALAGVIGSVTALIRAADESLPRESYKTLADGIAQVQTKCDQQHIQDHEELVSMRSYLDGYLRGQAPAAPSSPTLAPDAGAPSSTKSTTAPTATVVKPPPVVPTFLAPAPPAPWKAPDFDSVQRKAAKGS